MKLLWTGSDVLFAKIWKALKHSKKTKIIYMLGVWVFAKIADKFVECHYVVSKRLIPELVSLKLKKPIGVLIDPPKYIVKYNKKKHDDFNVLYYRGLGGNMPFKNWVYGYDIFKELKEKLPKINFIEVNGEENMSKIYPITDFYIRPNRHDGEPRMIMECEINDIPYYWSEDGKPDIDEIIKQISK